MAEMTMEEARRIVAEQAAVKARRRETYEALRKEFE